MSLFQTVDVPFKLMANDQRWVLPAGIDELLPAEAWQLEWLRRLALDLMRSWGYELVVPPLAEYLESLLTGVGEDLDIETFKLMDQATGKLLGIRADMTPQVARIDARYMSSEHPVRLCYFGPVLHSRARSLSEPREPMQMGAELYGSPSSTADSEVIELLVAILHEVGISTIHLDVGHVGVFRGLVEDAEVTTALKPDLYAAMQRKSITDLQQILDQAKVSDSYKNLICEMTRFSGDTDELTQIAERFTSTSDTVRNGLDNLQSVIHLLKQRLPSVKLSFDLAELRGYQYHTGVVFSVYVPGVGKEIGRGGRYDGIGQSFGRARPATGFSIDARQLLPLIDNSGRSHKGILAPDTEDKDCRQLIDKLRQQGERVTIQMSLNPDEATASGCDRKIVNSQQGWQVEPIFLAR